MSGVQSRRLSSESEYYGYLDYSEEQYSDYYRGNIMENSLEYHKENGAGGCNNSSNTSQMSKLINVSRKWK